MKNKEYLKKHLFWIIIIIFLFSFCFIILRNYEYQRYLKETNYKVNNLINLLKDTNINNEEIIKILNNDNYNDLFSNELGVNLNKENIFLKLDNEYKIATYINLCFILLVISIIIIIFRHYNQKKDLEIEKITKCIKRLNNEDYKLEIEDYNEGELSILKSELAKTTIMLKSIASNSIEDKKNLKNYLEDISHQIKTPLTSILINVDNLIANPQIDEKAKEEFLRDIKRDVNNIEFLVSTLLKLSKFDINSIKYNQEDVLITDLLKESINNISNLADLKNIKINMLGNKDIKINCDYKWQMEAITNIIKNAIEYANNNSDIDINFEQNKIYTMINIKNTGTKIKEEDLKHLFDRFYQGNNSHGFGIGLNLAKRIIEKDNGTISVLSNSNVTTFTIKYYKNML